MLINYLKSAKSTSNRTNLNCNERDELFSRAGLVGSASLSIMTFPLGILFDVYGSFVSRSLCTILMTIGLVCLMFAVEVNQLIFPGVAFLASGSFALLVTNHPLSQLFPKVEVLIVVIGQCVYQDRDFFSCSVPQ